MPAYTLASAALATGIAGFTAAVTVGLILKKRIARLDAALRRLQGS